MTDLVAGGLSAVALGHHPMMMPPSLVADVGSSPTPKPDAPAYVSPAISFDPETGIVFITFRNAESGKITRQIPPAEVLSRYRFVDESGIANPLLPRSTPDSIAGLGPDLGPPPKAPPTPPPPTTTTPTLSTSKFA